MFGEVIYYLLSMSLMATGIMMIIGLIRVFFKRWLTRNIVLLLWVFVVVRLLVPFMIPSDYSVTSAFGDYIARPVLVSEHGEGIELDLVVSNVIQQVEQYQPMTYRTLTAESVFNVLGYIWLIGVLLVGFLIVYTYRKHRSNIEMVYQKRYEGIDVYVSKSIKSPIVIGIHRPRIIMPVNKYQDIETFILLHEYCHIKRRDNLWKLIVTTAVVIHWFNPVCWWALRKFASDIELACDESVIRGLAKESLKDYALALVSANEQMNHYVTAFSSNQLGERVQAIVSYQRLSKRMMFVLAVLYGALAITLLTGCKEAVDEPLKIIREETDDLVYYTGFKDLPESYTLEAMLENRGIEAYEMSLEEIETMVSGFKDSAMKDESKTVRLIKYQEENKVGMFFEDLSYQDGRYYLFRSGHEEVSGYGYEYIKIIRSEKNPEFGHLVLTDNPEMTSDLVYADMISSQAKLGRPEYVVVLFLPREEDVLLDEIIIEDKTQNPVSTDQLIKIIEFMNDNEIKEGVCEGIECTYIDTELEADVTLVRVVLDYAWIDGIAVIHNDEVVSMFTGMSFNKLYVTDLNKDGIEELLFQTSIGSGIVRDLLMLCDLKDYSGYSCEFDAFSMITQLNEEEGELFVYADDYRLSMRSYKPIGKLQYDGESLTVVEYEELGKIHHSIKAYGLAKMQNGQYVRVEEPIFTEANIKSVNWSEHKIYFKKDFIEAHDAERIAAEYDELFASVGGLRIFSADAGSRFELEVDGEVVFDGDYSVGMLSSYMPMGYVMFDEVDGIRFSYGLMDSTDSDSRDDERLVQAFEDMGFIGD